ncbi:MAG TPA: hypothetical protein VFB50_10510 [Chloroflexota bacterium]|nr:hypothetical protein [Chloroflexota bacterium]
MSAVRLSDFKSKRATAYTLIKIALNAPVEKLDCDVSLDNRRRVLIQWALYTNPERDAFDVGNALIPLYEWVTRPETTADDLGISKRMVYRVLEAALAAGWVEVVDAGERAGRNRQARVRRYRADLSAWQGFGPHPLPLKQRVNGQVNDSGDAEELQF